MTTGEFILPYIDAEQPFVYNDNVLYYAVLCADFAIRMKRGRVYRKNAIEIKACGTANAFHFRERLSGLGTGKTGKK